MKATCGGCRSEELLRLLNRDGAGFRVLITSVGLFQKSPYESSIATDLRIQVVVAVDEGYFGL